MSDKETIAVYDKQVEAYADMVVGQKADGALKKFTASIPAGGRVLDLGCGPGNSSGYMQESGLKVDAVDASSEMVKMAKETFGVEARVAVFDDLDAEALYDGVWANFSLLHAAKQDFTRHLQQIHTALKPDGHFHIGMKLGDGEQRDSIGRLYSYYTEDELKNHLEEAGFEILWLRKGEEAGLSGEVSPFAVILTRKI
ncbi:MAG: class I SAM-dependent methyltransferase [Pseudomonadota bacterium]